MLQQKLIISIVGVMVMVIVLVIVLSSTNTISPLTINLDTKQPSPGNITDDLSSQQTTKLSPLSPHKDTKTTKATKSIYTNISSTPKTKTTQPLSKELPPGFPMIEPISEAETKKTEALIKQADEIIANMDKLLENIELPPLPPEQQAQLDKQQQYTKEQINQITKELEKLNN